MKRDTNVKRQPIPLEGNMENELKALSNNLEKVTKELKKVTSEMRSIKRGQGESHLYSLSFALLGIGISVIFYSANMLNQALNVHFEGLFGVFGSIAGILVGIFLTVIFPFVMTLAENKKKSKIPQSAEKLEVS